MSVLNLICRCSVISIKIPESYFVDVNKLIVQFIWMGRRLRITNTISKENNKVGCQTLPNFKTYCKVAALKTDMAKERAVERSQELRNRPT